MTMTRRDFGVSAGALAVSGFGPGDAAAKTTMPSYPIAPDVRTTAQRLPVAVKARIGGVITWRILMATMPNLGFTIAEWMAWLGHHRHLKSLVIIKTKLVTQQF